MDRLGVRVRVYWQGGLIDSRFVTSPRVRLGAVAGPNVDFVVPIVELDSPLVVAEIRAGGVTAWIPELGGATRGGARRLDVGEVLRFAVGEFTVELAAEPARRLPRFNRLRLEGNAARVLMLSVAVHVLFAVGAALSPEAPALAELRAQPKAVDVNVEAGCGWSPRTKDDLYPKIQTAVPRVSACLAGVAPPATLRLVWTIDHRGVVSEVRTEERTGAISEAQALCVHTVMEALEFGPSASKTTVRYPWIVGEAPKD
ncbi:MAG: hypothetical protein RIT81_39655 [Deltaproteobacteria bacterium]